MDSSQTQTSTHTTTQTKVRPQAIALLGQRDEPADGVQDYCECLAREMDKSDWTLDLVRVPWPQQGWLEALGWLSREAEPWRGRWVLVQYTALAWSRRGFPLGFLAVLWILRRRGARCVVVFHDTTYGGQRWIDRLRRNMQTRIMRTAYRWSEHSVLTLAFDKAAWLPAAHPKAAFIPVGANVPSLYDLAREEAAPDQNLSPATLPSLVVFGVSTWPSAQKQEVDAIVHAAREAASRLGPLTLLVMGRGALEAQAALREGLASSQVALAVLGMLSAQDVSVHLAKSDAMLFVRGGLSSRRGSGLAAIACSVPIVAYRDHETGFPLDEGGIVFVRQNDLAELADKVTQVLSDSHLRDSLRARNEILFWEWFSWGSIARRMIAELNRAPEAQ